MELIRFGFGWEILVSETLNLSRRNTIRQLSRKLRTIALHCCSILGDFESGSMKRVLTWSMVFGLLILHQDYWQWERQDIVLGFLPHTVAYHLAISLLTAGTWLVVCTWLWPSELEDKPPDGADFR